MEECIYIHLFLTSALVRGRWVGPKASLSDVEKRKFLILPGLDIYRYIYIKKDESQMLSRSKLRFIIMIRITALIVLPRHLEFP
jgi:hypothetical protein